MKVVLVNPPSPFLADDKAQPPMALLYLAGSLEKAGFNVEVEDLAGRKDWRQRASELEADVFGVTSTTPQSPLAKEIATLLPEDSFKIVGGAHPTFVPQDFKGFFDVAVVGEGENILPILVRDRSKYAGCWTISYGNLVDVNEIPLPARHLVNLWGYRPEMEGHATTIFTSRGCSFNCAFCCKVTGSKVRFRNIGNIVEELQILIDEYGFRNIIFEDDNLCLVRKRALNIFRAIRRFGVNFRICPRADEMDKNLLREARESRVTEVSFGVESGSQKMLNLMNKRLSVDKAKQAINDAKSLDMTVKVYLIVGFPGETWDTIEETKRFIKDTEPDKWLLQNFVPYPGTDVWVNPIKYGVTWISGDYGKFYTVGKGGKGGIVFRTERLSEETIRLMHDDLYAFLMDYKPMDRG